MSVGSDRILSPGSIIPLPDSVTAQECPSMSKTKREQEKQRAYRKNKLFRRIEADIKERDRKRIPGRKGGCELPGTCAVTFFLFSCTGRPEEYIDRDRLIAVSMTGQVDIREQMLKQRFFLSSKSGSGSVFSSLVATENHGHKILVEQAVHEMKRGANKVALSYLNKALAVSLHFWPMKPTY